MGKKKLSMLSKVWDTVWTNLRDYWNKKRRSCSASNSSAGNDSVRIISDPAVTVEMTVQRIISAPYIHHASLTRAATEALYIPVPFFGDVAKI